MEKSFLAMKVQAAGEQIRLAQDQIDLAIQSGEAGSSSIGAMGSASENLKDARSCLDEMGRHIEIEVEPPMRACSACGRSIRVQATLCGYCWHKQ
jgi:hypothetical protein